MDPLPSLRHIVDRAGIVAALLFLAAISRAQTTPVERTFREPKSAVEKALKPLQPSLSGHLPTLEGFARAAEHPLNRYQRAFYQCTVQVGASPAGGSVVRVSAKVTAWYADANASRAGYELVTSNGRIENDVLDQLSEQLASSSAGADEQPPVPSAPLAKPSTRDEPAISAPVPGSGTTGAFSPSLGQGLASSITPPRDQPMDTKFSQKGSSDLQAETASLEEVLKNQAHPRNLVAVKKSGTPIVGSPSLTGKTLFLASAQDEFEMLDYNADWVHVRISGPSRGWIWRTSLEMPEGISDVPQNGAQGAPTAADLFQVSREETGQFPGDWEPLRGKNVKIISVQKVRENEQGGGAAAKLAFAKSLLGQTYEELTKSPDLSGLVLIFDSADGGMIAATLPTIQRWRAGTLNDAAMWHQCYFDPPETFTITSAAGAR
ncbi:MAG: hypothetical protein WAU58_13960 [Terriglobales bacterium]